MFDLCASLTSIGVLGRGTGDGMGSLHPPVKHQVTLCTDKPLFMPSLQALSPCERSMGDVFITGDFERV